MSASVLEVKQITFNEKLHLLVNKPGVHIEELDEMLLLELKIVASGKALSELTQLIHLVSFIKAKRFSNPTAAVQIFMDENTTQETRDNLVNALMMAPKEEDKIYDLICLLAQKNKLAPYTQVIKITPAPIYSYDDYYEEDHQWLLIFDLFGLCKNIPQELIPLLARLLITSSCSAGDLFALRKLLALLGKFELLQTEIIEPLLPYLRYQTTIEKLHLLLLNLDNMSLPIPIVLKAVSPLLDQMDALSIFFSVYQEELQLPHSLLATLEKLPLYCQLSLPQIDSYDDKVPTNTPLHQAIIDNNISNLWLALDLANPQLFLTTSYKNTALLLACKLADQRTAKLILARMRELGCDVNHADQHGMTALHWAHFYHFNDLIAELIAAGANPQLKTLSGKSPKYFSEHSFTLEDLKIEGKDIIEDAFKLKNNALTDVAFHMDKIVCHLKLATPDEIKSLFLENESAQIRAANRFYLFFKTFRTRLIEWQGKHQHMGYHGEQLTVDRNMST